MKIGFGLQERGAIVVCVLWVSLGTLGHGREESVSRQTLDLLGVWEVALEPGRMFKLDEELIKPGWPLQGKPTKQEVEAEQKTMIDHMNPDISVLMKDTEKGAGVSGGSPVSDWPHKAMSALKWVSANVPVTTAKIADEKENTDGRYYGNAWFRRSFQVPPDWKERRVVLHFHGVTVFSKVWVNGQYLGENLDPYLLREFIVTDVLNYGGQNTVVVFTSNATTSPTGLLVRKDLLPTVFPYHPFGGILREVELVATDPVYLDTMRLEAEPEGDRGRLSLTVKVANALESTARVALSAEVTDRKGSLLKRLEGNSDRAEIRPQTQREMKLEGWVDGVTPWSPKQPALYFVKVRIETDRGYTDDRTIRFGFRKLEVRNGKIYLNDKPVFVLGFNMYEDYPETDTCVNPQRVKEDLETMKNKYGCNGIAFPVYPASQQAYDLCDELGMLATGENDFWGWEEEDAMLPPQQYDRLLRSAERHLRKMVEQYGHHPSIFIWSVSCENGCSPRVRALNSHMIAYTRHLDPTRPVMHVTNKLPDDTFEADDVVGCNIYGKGWHATTAVRGAERLAPNKPVLIKEFGSPVSKGIRPVVRLPEEGEARFIHEYHPQGIEAAFQNMLSEAKKDTAMARLAGGFVWVWARHPWPVKGGKYAYGAPLSPFGVHTRDRKVYPEYVKILQKDPIRRIIRLYEEEVLPDQ